MEGLLNAAGLQRGTRSGDVGMSTNFQSTHNPESKLANPKAPMSPKADILIGIGLQNKYK